MMNDAETAACELVLRLSDADLARVFRDYFGGGLDSETYLAVSTFYDVFLAETTRRVGTEAQAAAAAEEIAFKAKHGITDDWTESQYDELFASMDDETFHSELHGHVWHLIEALEARGK